VRGERWGPRTLDVDVLLVGDERIDEPDLVVPAPADGTSGTSCSRRSPISDPGGRRPGRRERRAADRSNIEAP
jgi:2-amino-4-hydroxy-6-hydroxymethyldihydropteridine diphosphokinase